MGQLSLRWDDLRAQFHSRSRNRHVISTSRVLRRQQTLPHRPYPFLALALALALTLTLTLSPSTEPPRNLRRLFSLKGLSHEQEVEPFFTRGPRTRCSLGQQEHRGGYPSLGAAIESIAPKIGCVPQTLNEWVKRDEIDSGARAGVTTPDLQRLKEL